VVLAQFLVKMANVQIEILLSIEAQYFLHCSHGHTLARGFAPPPIKQAVVAELLLALADAPHMPVRNTHNLCRLPPGDFSGPGPQHHFLYFHRPLHLGLRVREHALHLFLPLAARKADKRLRIKMSAGQVATGAVSVWGDLAARNQKLLSL
jgi:hypothetical protein